MHGQRLRHTVRVMKPVHTRSDLGEDQISWLKIAERPCAIVPVSAADRTRADQPVSDVTQRIRMWWYEGLRHDHRLEMDGRVFEISSIINRDERNKTMECLCTEQGGAA